MNLLFTLNHSYLFAFETCLKSIVRFTPKEKYHIYVLHSDLTQEDQRCLHQYFDYDVIFHFLWIDEKTFEDFPESYRYPQAMYYRLLAAFLLPSHLEKILYLDPDTIVINPLDELYEMDFDDAYFIACTHVRKLLNKINEIRLGLDIKEEHPYINSGVILMNLKSLRIHQNIQEMKDYIQLHAHHLTLPDQDILTALYGNKIKIVDYIKYNLSDRMLLFYNASLKHHIDLKWIQEHTVIIHYCGKNKPWNEHYVGVLKRFYDDIK